MKLKLLNTVTFILVIFVNYLANALPINGYTTGELSSFYPNLFVPAGVTFSIWGIIYLFLFGFIAIQWFPKYDGLVKNIGYWFTFNCLLNCSWIVAWHYRLEELSLIIMILLLTSIIKLYQITKQQTDRSFITFLTKVPFSIYFAWICVATIANFTTVLVHWNFSPSHPEFWASALILITQILVWIVNSRYVDFIYSLTIIWAIGGIILKQTNLNGPEIIIYTGYGCIVSSIVIFSIIKLRLADKNS